MPISDAKPDAKGALDGELKRRLELRTATVSVIGLGYVGLPLALTAAKAGFHVIGFDIDPIRVERLNRGESLIPYLDGDAVRIALESGRFSSTTDFGRLDEPDAIVICVPTPLTKHREPDLSYVTNSAEAIAARLRRGQLIVLESTTYPGTTTELVKPILERTGLVSGRDFYLGFSPEREDPGSHSFVTATIPKVVSGDGEAALAAMEALYGAMIVRTVPVSSPSTAEAVKLTENIFRAVNIALINELKLLYKLMGIDVWEVIEAAKTKPFGFTPFYPGPGLGGHCIPIDPFYLTWKAREYGVSTHFIELAGQINTAMPRYVVDCVAAEMDQRQKRGLNGSRILVLGIAYKKNIDDLRESPALKLIELLEERGATTLYHDQHIPFINMTRDHPTLAGRSSTPLDAKLIAGCDAVLIATDHDDVDYRLVVDTAKLVVDTRNVCARVGATGDSVVKA